MKKVLLIRRKKEYFYHGEVGWTEHNFTKEMVQIWNFFFGMQYLHFRKELVRIAQITSSQNDFDLIIEYEDQKTVSKLPPGSLLLPIDEDDWIIPNMINDLEEVFDNRNICWDVYRVGTNGSQQCHRDEKNIITQSCGYCVVLPIEFGKITYHWKFKQEGSKYIHKILSLKLDSPASIGVLRRHENSFEEMIKRIYGWISSSYQVPKEFQENWKEYMDLCEELLGSCKLPYKHIIEGI